MDATKKSTGARQPKNTVERVLRYCHEGGEQADKPSDHPKSVKLPSFGSLSNYGISEARTSKLWGFEIKRLMDAGTNSETGSFKVFPELEESDDLLFYSISEATSYSLENLSRRILCSLYISCLDDDVCSGAGESPSFNRVANAKAYLQSMTEEQPDIPGETKAYHEMRKSDELRSEERSQTREYKKRHFVRLARITKPELKQYVHIVDQVTAVLAFVAIQSSPSIYWELLVLACLAKLSTKMKALANHVNKSIGVCLGHSSSVTTGTERFSSNPAVDRYAKHHRMISTLLSNCIENVLRNLGADMPLNKRWDDLDLCAFVYEAGTPATRTLVYQDRWGGIGGTSDTVSLSWVSKAMELALELSGSIDALNPRPPSNDAPPTAKSSNVTVELTRRAEMQVDGNVRHGLPDDPVEVRNFVQLVVLITPLSLALPRLAGQFAFCIRRTSALPEFGAGNVIQTSVVAKGFISLKIDTPRTERRETRRRYKEYPHHPGHEGQPEISSLSTSLLVGRHSVNDRLRSTSNVQSTKSRLRRLQDLVGKSEKTQSIRDQLNDLTIQETSILVKCHLYVSTTFACTAAIVVGGLVSAFVVGERIPGVDPFNLAMYAWIIGGFILLVSKVIHVSEWTWREFFLGEVACRRLSEVSSLTGLDPQDILVHLLSTEGRTILCTGGPYQRCFSKEAYSEGFSIDVMPTVRTLNEAGILLVKVGAVEGPELILLRLIPGSSGPRYIDLGGYMYDADVFINRPRQGGGAKAIIVRRDVDWNEVLGLYS